MSKKSSSSKSSSRSSLGGTLVGFIVGLLVGLAAALAVAVYVTRVPVPFVDRGLSRSAEDDAKEAERNKGWNPNRGVSGAPAAPPAAPGAAPGTEGAISVPPTDGRTLYRVRVGPFAQKALADLTIEQLQVNGVESALVRIQR